VIPEISVARKETEHGAAKLAVFAYEKESGRPIWQSGIAQAKSTAQDYWILGAGPFQRGSIYEKTQFAGQKLRLPRIGTRRAYEERPLVALYEEHVFEDENDPERIARNEKLRKFVDELPRASAEEWLTPLTPTVSTELGQKLEWR
jgi:hypothetical protein